MIRGLVRIGVDNPVFLNLAFAFVLLAGVLGWRSLPKEEFPQVSADRVIVSQIYPGASPESVEELILRPLEDALGRVEGVKHVYADATDGLALVTVEFVRGTDADAARDAVEREVTALDDLPEDARSPRISLAKLRIPLIHLGLTGDTRRVDVADDLAEALLTLPFVGQVDQEGADERVVRVRLDPARAAAHRITADDVARAVEAAGTGLPAGELTLGAQEVLVRTEDAVLTPDDLARVPLRTDGADLRVGDVARVETDWLPPRVFTRVDGQPCIDLVVSPADGADALDAVPKLRAWAAEKAATLPPGMGLVAYDDSARQVGNRIGILASNGGVGLLLVALVLVLFIGLRNAAIVVWGMPVAYLGAVAMMQLSGTTVNVISTFGLLLVTGIIVDDAVVIVENVQRHLEMGKDRVTATLDGTAEVASAVFSATVTTCLAFAPLLMLEGTVGRVMRIVPTVVILSLLASLFEAFFVLPGHLGHHAEEAEGRPENLPTRLLKQAYRPLLDRAVRRGWRLPSLLLVGLLLGGVFGLGSTMRLSLTTEGNPIFAFVNLDLPPSADPDATRAAVRRVEDLVGREADGMAIYVSSRIGEQRSPQGFPTLGNRYGQVKIGFQDDPDVLADVPRVLAAVEAHLRDDPQVVSHAIETLKGGPPSGKPIDVRVRGKDEAAVFETAVALEAHLRSRAGVEGVRTDATPGAVTYRVEVDPGRAAALGLREAQVALAVRAALDGNTALEMAVDERTTEVRVGTRAPTDRAQLADLPVVLPDRRVVRLRQLADVVRSRSPERIRRVDGQRAVRVTADVDDALTSSTEEQQALEAAYAGLTAPGTTLFYGGELADSAESFAQLPAALALAVTLIYAVLAIQFRSYLQPVIILSAVPLGAAGVVLGLFLFGMDLSFIAMIGGVGLAGIVVNDSLVLVEFINLARRAGMDVEEAVVDASLTRLRPILITTVTTVLGLLPLALGVAGSEPLLAPMAVAISFGLAFATGLTLVVVPVLYLVLDDVGRFVSARLPGGHAPT